MCNESDTDQCTNISVVSLFWFICSCFSTFSFTVITARYPLYFTVRVGDDVTLPCEDVKKDHVKCVNTTWLFTASGNALTLFEHGKIHENSKSRSDRLSVTEKCSLVIKKVTVEDVGVYTCRQFDQSGRQQGEDVSVKLSVVISEYLYHNVFSSNCLVRTRYRNITIDRYIMEKRWDLEEHLISNSYL